MTPGGKRLSPAAATRPAKDPLRSALRLEAPTGVEPVMEVLQTSALPLGYGADRDEKVLARNDLRNAARNP